MTTDNGDTSVIDERLRAMFPDDVPPEVAQRMQQHLAAFRGRLAEEYDKPSLPTRARDWKTPSLVATAAGVAIICTAWFVMSSRTPSLYAQAITAVRAARTIHATAARFKNEKQTDIAEIWYDAGCGVREEERSNGAQSVRLDDGRFEWVYRAATNTVIKGPSRDTVGAIKDVLHPLEAIDKIGAERSPSLDATFHGAACRAFVAVRDERAPRMRFVSWLDEHDRLIRFEEQIGVGGKWTLDERADLRYDVPIPTERFAANFPADARVIDRTATLDSFGVDDALATAERLGIVLAIHTVRRVDDDTVFVMSTSRASQRVIDRFGHIDSRRDGGKVYGQFMWSSNGRRLPDGTWLDGMQPVRLASWTRDGIGYQWVLLRHIPPWAQEGSKLTTGFRVYTRNEWQESLQSAGKSWHLNGVDVLTLDVPKKSEGLEAILADVYEQTLSMGDATKQGAPHLHLKSIPFTKQDIEKAVASGSSRLEAEGLLHGRSSQPQNITLDDWRREVRAMIAD